MQAAASRCRRLHLDVAATRARASYTSIYTWSAQMHADELPTSTHRTHRTDMTHVRCLCDTCQTHDTTIITLLSPVWRSERT